MDNHESEIPPRHRWVAEVLHRAGARLGPATEGVYACELGEEIGGFLGRTALHLTFQRKAALAGTADLAVPGSWLHDQLLRYARDRGRVTRGFLPPRSDLDRAHVLATRRREPGKLVEKVDQRYGSLLVFTFRVFYYSEPAEEDVLHVGYDAQRQRVVRRSLSRLVSEATAAPERDGYSAPARPDVRAAFTAAWSAVQDEVEERVRVLEEAGRAAYAARIRTVESYYRQLLTEEKRLLESRASRKGQDESKGRIDLLKVEWERRMKEEADRLRPQVVARLSAVATLHVPLERWRVAREEGDTEAGEWWIDLARGEAWPNAPAAAPGHCVGELGAG